MIYKKQKETKEVDENGDILKDMEEKEMVRYFRPVCVFDIGQTMGKPVPGPDIEITGNSHQKLLHPLLQYIKKQGIKTIFRKINLRGKEKPHHYKDGGIADYKLS